MQRLDYEPRFAATAIGSLPHTDVGRACRLMLDNLPEIPAWPQLPHRAFLENMYVQYSEGMPGVKVDLEAERIWFQVDGDLGDALATFYQAIIDEDLEHFAMSERYAAGLAAFLSGGYAGELSGRPLLKGQVTGPISLGLTVTDQAKKASLYHEQVEVAIVQGLTWKARWQVERLRAAAPDAGILLFIDEPYLVSVGSALIAVTGEQVVRDISDVAKGCGADLVGIHCCGNTDWSLVFDAGVDVVNFDAYDYMEGFIAYHERIAAHVESGGIIAWGIVPDDEKALSVGLEDLAGRLEEAFDTLEARGVDRGLLARGSILSPACGLGSTTQDAAKEALAATAGLSTLMRGRYF
ncbi:MAG: hypothetical protein KKF41_06735 [Actinobacteria bacterium]|nr:hypothetical protein [Actinomycetota bacterium]